MGVVDGSVNLLLVDALQDIKAWHPSPLRKGTPFTFIKGFLGKYMVLNEEHTRLQNMRIDGCSMEVGKTVQYKS